MSVSKEQLESPKEMSTRSSGDREAVGGEPSAHSQSDGPTGRFRGPGPSLRLVAWAPLILVLGFLVLVPLASLTAKAGEEGLDVIDRMFELRNFRSTILNTVGLAVGSTVIALVLGTALALCASRLPARGRGVLGLVPILPLLVPAVAETTGFVFLLSPRVGYVNVLLRETPFFNHLQSGPIDVFTIQWIILLTGFTLTAFVFLFVHTSLKQMGGELQAAALASGASEVRTFFTVTLPLLRPSLVYAGGVVLLLGMGQFTKPLILGRSKGIDVITTQMWYLKEQYPIDYVLGAAIGVPLIVAGVAFVFLQRRMLGDTQRFVVVTGKARHDPLRTSWLFAIPIILYSAIAVVLPIGALVVVALSDYWGAPLRWGADLSLTHVNEVLADARWQDAITTTVQTSLVALLIVLPIGFLTALALARGSRLPRSVRSIVEIVSMIPLAMPAALFGFSILYAYTGPPFELYGTTALIVIAYVTLMIPHALRPQLASMIAIGGEYSEASRAAGAGPIRTALYVTLPLLRRSVSVAAVITLALLFHEFAASMMVRSGRTQVMGTLLYDYWSSGVYGEVAVTALLMCVVTTVAIGIATAVGGRGTLENI